MPERGAPKTYTATQVGTLIESFQKEQHMMAEGIVDLRRDMTELKHDVADLKEWRLSADGNFRVIFSSLQGINTSIESLAGEVRGIGRRMDVAEERLAHGR